MATDYQLLSLSLDSISHYDKSPHTLGLFIDDNTFANAINTSLTNFIIHAIIEKLTERAFMLLESRIVLYAILIT